jgi:ATP-dependent Zn protease
MRLDNDVDLDALASSTPGMAGTDLASLATEAALLAARRNHSKVTMADFTEFPGEDLARHQPPQRSQTQWLVDQEVQHTVDTAHKQVTEMLTEHRTQLKSRARALLAAETLDTADAYAAAKMLAEVAESEPATAQGRVA